MSVFAFIVIDFLYYEPPNTLSAIVAIILSRQVCAKINVINSDLYGLFGRRMALKALLIDGHYIETGNNYTFSKFWQFANINKLKPFISDIVSSRNNDSVLDETITFMPSGSSNVLAYKFLTLSPKQDFRPSYYLKIYNKNQRVFFENETYLLGLSSDLPALQAQGTGEIKGFNYSLFSYGGEKLIDQKAVRDAELSIRKSMMGYVANPFLVNKYQVSHKMLWQKIDKALLERLSDIGDTLPLEESERVQMFLSLADDISSRLEQLPLAIVNPDLRRDNILVTNTSDYKVLYWGRWSVEPVGAGWPIKPYALKKMPELHAYLCSSRTDMNLVNKNDMYLAALMYQFDLFWKRQKIADSLALIPEICNCLKVHNPHNESLSNNA